MHNTNIQQLLQNVNIATLNPMQQASLQAFAQHKKILLLSGTGSGKTIAFLLPAVVQLQNIARTQAMILVPSRELAQQIETVFKQMKTGLKITACYGGHKREVEENSLRVAPAIIVGTPGRLADHIRRGNIAVETINMLFLDEFDKTLELGFSDEMQFIYASLQNLERFMLISATHAAAIPDFIDVQGLEKLQFIEEEEKETDKLSYAYLMSNDKDKTMSLYELMCFINNRKTIVFCNHRDAVERVYAYVKEKGIIAAYYHGAMLQDERDIALAKFRNGSASYLITTDIAARGLDIAHIRYIVHYHLPATLETYMHRNGRTARMDASGSIVLLTGPEEQLPGFITNDLQELKLPAELSLPAKPDYVMLYLPLGKKNKISKTDIAGFVIQQGHVKKEDVGLIEIKDFHSFIAIKRMKAAAALQALKDKKIKNKLAKIEVAK